MTNLNSKIGFVFVLYKTPLSEIKRLEKEVKNLKIIDYRLYFIDNSESGQGFAAGANLGIKKAIDDGCDLFVIANPDISLVKLFKLDILDAFDRFDIFGYAMKQQKKVYYGGSIDKWRMSGGLIEKKPSKRFIE
ncbi:MAG: hypothetical protein NUV58_03535, partial [Candidatus Roizmanbacteria bacterium]|nr:hypothetical protein [Candidatus Roizmanbacteria bacterium]